MCRSVVLSPSACCHHVPTPTLVPSSGCCLAQPADPSLPPSSPPGSGEQAEQLTCTKPLRWVCLFSTEVALCWLGALQLGWEARQNENEPAGPLQKSL